jgi:hypothetical protein
MSLEEVQRYGFKLMHLREGATRDLGIGLVIQGCD